MANLYYDVKTGTRFTPYVGAGAGVAFGQMKRSYSESAALPRAPTNDVAGALSRSAPENPTCSGTQTTFANADGAKGINSWGPALALMAGTSVDLSTGVKFDAGYRMMWQGNTPSISLGSVMGDISKISAGARTDHELRMGVRWDIW